MTDIKNHRTKERLKESEEKYKKLIESIPHGIAIIQHDKVVFVNKAAIHILGYKSKNDIIGQKGDIGLFLQDKERVYEKCLKLLDGKIEGPITYNAKAVKKDGKTIPVELYASKITYDGWRALQIVMMDISERVDSQKNYLNILDSIADPIHVLDRDLRLVYLNDSLKAWIKDLDLEREEMRDRKLNEVFPFLEPKIMKEYEYVLQTGKILITDESTKLGDDIIYTESRKIPILENNEVSQVLTIIRDFTKRKLYEKKLKNSEKKYRSLFENAPYSIFLINMEGKIIDCNQASVELFGFSKEEMIGGSHRELNIHPEKKIKLYIKRFVQLIKGNSVKPIETQLITKERELIWVNVRSSLVSIGNEEFIQTIIQDIREKKRVEDELKRLNEIKSDLLKRTSHELKTPLVSIKGFTNLLLELHKGEFNSEIISMMNEIKKGCIRLENLVNDILITAELKSGKMELKKSRINLEKIIKNSVIGLEGLIKLRAHDINLDLNHDLFVKCEKKRIREVICNILMNAIKYTPPNGRIEIKSKVKEDSITISFKDTGLGLTKEEMEKIFTQFGKIERYGQGFDVISEGTGLGLYVSKKILELHGGNIWVESKGRNKGCTFYFSLPKD
ncbi:MAG: PAS domain S-box protein [Promethearchaeota archaeon]|nr:MAG: PAS domain S-box protein [Candidatus Lokiarchaeota archaeon]